MGTAAQHQHKAEHHLRFLATISDDYPDWLTTVAFYAAVEVVEGMLATRSFHSKNHEDRKNAVRHDFNSIYKAYHALYNASLDTRYQSSEHWPSAGEVRDKLIGMRLAHIRSFAASRAAS
jgi:hypothetical protein